MPEFKLHAPYKFTGDQPQAIWTGEVCDLDSCNGQDNIIWKFKQKNFKRIK